jgi:hypothetical protein
MGHSRVRLGTLSLAIPALVTADDLAGLAAFPDLVL